MFLKPRKNTGGGLPMMGAEGEPGASKGALEPRKCVLVVDDDAQVRALLREMLEMEGFRVRECADGREVAAVLGRERVDLITLDLILEGEDGLAVARNIRAKWDVPIIMISAKRADIDRVVGLELGADDYISKPFNVREVLARVRAVLRRCEGPAQKATPAVDCAEEKYLFDGWILDMAARELRGLDDRAIELTTMEFNLLGVLVRRPLRVFSRNGLMDALKGHDWTPLDRTIDGLIARLRRKIEPDPERPTLIKTVRGVGYVFAAPVSRAERRGSHTISG